MKPRRRFLGGAILLLAAMAAAAVATAPPELVNEADVPAITADLDSWLASRERDAPRAGDIIPDTEKRIRWQAGRRGGRTHFSVVYLHGFSATRQEIAPVAEQVADALGANLFETRLAGHGYARDPLSGVRAEDWLDDAAEALTIGAAIGERVVLMGTSTGATLALAMVDHQTFRPVSALVLISPNFGPSDPSAEYLTWPGGPQLAYMVAGDTHSWTPRNERQARYWATSYPMDAVVEMMRLVDYTRDKLPLQLETGLLVLYSPADTVVDTGWIRAAYREMLSPHRRLIEVSSSGDPSNHVLAGDIMAPENNDAVVTHIVDFIRAAP